MSSKGLGRGLSSLLKIYEDTEEDEVTPKLVKKEEKSVKNAEKTSNSGDLASALKNANDLLEKYKNKKPVEKVDDEVDTKWRAEKQSLEKKIEKVSKEMFPDVGSRQMSLSHIQPNPDQPRKNFNQEALRELAQSIKSYGIIQPLIVSQKDDKYIIIAGERRYRAAKIAGLKTVPVIIRDYNEQQTREIALIENLQREDLNPIETAIAIKQLIDIYNFTQEEVAEKLGKSRPVIANTLRLLHLEPEVLTLVEKGKLAPGIARAVITLPREQQLVLAKKACDDKMTARDVEKTVQEITNPVYVEPKKAVELSLEIKNLRNMMQEVLGTKVSVIGNNKKGRIYIDYYSQDDLDRIFDFFNK